MGQGVMGWGVMGWGVGCKAVGITLKCKIQLSH